MSIEAAKESDLAGIRWLLGCEDLPNEDLTAQSLKYFFVCRNEEGVTGAIGLERYGTVGLLRSLVVDEGYRGSGIGKQLVIAAESLARRLGITSLYLLTTTAQQYFQRRGYQVIQRATAPEPIQKTREFSELCPESSALMVKQM